MLVYHRPAPGGVVKEASMSITRSRPAPDVRNNDAEFYYHQLELVERQFNTEIAQHLDSLRTQPRRFDVLFREVQRLNWICSQVLECSKKTTRAMLDLLYEHDHVLQPRVVRRRSALEPVEPAGPPQDLLPDRRLFTKPTPAGRFH